MDDLSIWAQVSIVAGAALLGPAAAFLLALLIATLLRSMSAANEPPALVLVVAGRIARLLRRNLWLPAEAAPRSAGEDAGGGIASSSPVRVTGPAPSSP